MPSMALGDSYLHDTPTRNSQLSAAPRFFPVSRFSMWNEVTGLTTAA